MTEDTDAVTDGLRRAIAAADAANDAAEDIARLGKAQKDFVEQVGAAQKRSSAMALGATVAAVICLALATLVYFRSVRDLHEAAELQAEAAKLVAVEVLALKQARDSAASDKDDEIAKALAVLPDAVATAVAAKLAEPGAEPASGAAPDVLAAIEASRDEVLSAMAELALTGAAPANSASPDAGGTPVAAATGDLSDIRETLARIEAGLLRITAAPAAAPANRVAPAKAPSAPAAAGPKTAAKPAARPAAEPNPFVYP